MADFPLVSLLVPCYNHEEFLDDNLLSLIGQDYENIELLICDDCSADGSFPKIQSYESKLKSRFPRVVILKNEVNRGVTGNINRMLAMARGSYIKILASDDAMAPGAIRAMVGAMQADPRTDVLIAGGMKVTQEQHYPDFGKGDAVYPQAPDLSAGDLFYRTALCNEIFAPGAFISSRVFEKYGHYDETIPVEDFEFWLRLLKDGEARFRYLDEQLIYYRVSGGSITSMSGNAGLERRRRLFHRAEMDTLNKYKAHLPEPVYAQAVMRRILDERWLARKAGLDRWERELQQEWESFPCRKALPKKTAVRFFWQKLKLDLGKHRP